MTHFHIIYMLFSLGGISTWNTYRRGSAFYILFLYCRDEDWKGLSQFVNLTAGVRYSMSGYVKLLNTVNNALYHPVDIVMGCSNDQGKSFSFSLPGPLGSQWEFLL